MASGPQLKSPPLVAFYLPQFHPIPVNDRFWGPGFTEWRNVVTARRLFPGHYQPHLPRDLGFYDLRVPEVQYAQAELASRFGVDALCYYHYWFEGHQVLDRPLNQLVSHPDLDHKFCICWANENWTRAWDGTASQVLIRQGYSRADDLAHVRALLPTVGDPRYLRVNGRAVVLIYRPENLPNPRETTELWRQELVDEGLGDPLLLCVQSLRLVDPATLGFDAGIHFAPNWLSVQGARNELWTAFIRRSAAIGRRLGTQMGTRQTNVTVLDYDRLAQRLVDQWASSQRVVPCVATGWDNSPRRTSGGSFVIHDSTPEKYGRWLTTALETAAKSTDAPPLVFVNAWNEWAEGAHLEPCQRWEDAYLRATAGARSVVDAALVVRARTPDEPGVGAR